jgi:hypothetical protein
MVEGVSGMEVEEVRGVEVGGVGIHIVRGRRIWWGWVIGVDVIL